MGAKRDDVVRISRYKFAETLGCGTFGKVKVAIHEITGHKVAIKMLNRQKMRSLDVVLKVKREIENIQHFRHPHIVKFYQVISTPLDIYVVMEYVPAGDFFDFLLKYGKLKESLARRFFQQLISGLDYCHRHMVVHRDLKPENILLDNHQNIKIADFGLANVMKDGMLLKSSCGSPNYAAPEVISGKLYLGDEVDVWSAGVILYAMLCSSLPFDDDHVPSLFKKIKNGIYSIPTYISRQAADLITKILQVDVSRRATIKIIKEHEWFLKDLSPSLFPQFNTDRTHIDEFAVEEICEKFDVSPDMVYESLYDPDRYNNQLAVTYHLIMDNRRMTEEGDSLGNDRCSGDQSSESKVIPHPEKMPELVEVSSDQRGNNDNILMQTKRKTKWHLGIRSQSRSHDIMLEIYRVLKLFNYEWKIISNFHIIIRRWNRSRGEYTKISMELYQIDQHNHLLDFVNLLPALSTVNEQLEDPNSCQTLSFFDMCSELITALTR